MGEGEAAKEIHYQDPVFREGFASQLWLMQSADTSSCQLLQSPPQVQKATSSEVTSFQNSSHVMTKEHKGLAILVLPWKNLMGKTLFIRYKTEIFFITVSVILSKISVHFLAALYKTGNFYFLALEFIWHIQSPLVKPIWWQSSFS